MNNMYKRCEVNNLYKRSEVAMQWTSVRSIRVDPESVLEKFAIKGMGTCQDHKVTILEFYNSIITTIRDKSINPSSFTATPQGHRTL